MTAHISELIDEAQSHRNSRRRSRTASSTGLDYSTCSPCEEDVLWQTQGLLISLSKHLPSCKSWARDSSSNKEPSIAGFDFTTAKSVAGEARRESRKFIPPLRATISKSTGLSPKMKKQSAVRSSISMTDLRASEQCLDSVAEKNNKHRTRAGNGQIPHTLMTCCSSEEDIKASKTTRPVLQDKIPVRKSSVAKGSRAKSVDNTRSRRQSISQFTVTHRDIARLNKDFKANSLVSIKPNPILKEVSVQSPQIVPGRLEHQPSEHLDRYLRDNSRQIPRSYRSEVSHDSAHDIDASHPSTLAEPLDKTTTETSFSIPRSPVEFVVPALFPRTNTKPGSVVSGASKSSAHRHALLKSSISPSQPLDLGLPVQPLLTSVPIIFSRAIPETAAEYTKVPVRHSHDVGKIAPIVALENVLSDLKAEKYDSGREESTIQEQCEVDSQKVKHSEHMNKVDKTPKVAEYWGFHDNLKDSVEDAVKNAVRKVVHHVVLPPDSSHHEASKAYRMLIAESLAEAARTADEYLGRSSTWDSPACGCSRVSSPIASHEMENVPLNTSDNVDAPKVGGCAISHCREEPLQRYGHADNTADGGSGILEPSTEPADSSLPQKSTESVRDEVPQLRRHSSANAGHLTESGPQSRSMSWRKVIEPKVEKSPESSRKSSVDHRRASWLENLVSRSSTIKFEDYTPQLTALPDRIQREQRKKQNRIDVGVDGYLDDCERRLDTQRVGSRASENFTKTINDLEHLLNEALYIARCAADTDDNRGLPGLLEDAAAVLHEGRGVSKSVPGPRRRQISKTKSSGHGNLVQNNRSSCSLSEELIEKGHHAEHHELSKHVQEAENQLRSPLDALPLPPVIVTTDVTIPTEKLNLSYQDQSRLPRSSLIIPKQPIAGLREQQRGPQIQNDKQTTSQKINRDDQNTTDVMVPCQDDSPHSIMISKPLGLLPNKWEVKEYIRVFRNPPIEARISSLGRRQGSSSHQDEPVVTDQEPRQRMASVDRLSLTTRHSFDGPQEAETVIDFNTPHGIVTHMGILREDTPTRYDLQDSTTGQEMDTQVEASNHPLHRHGHNMFSLNGKHHVSIDHYQGFSLSRSHKRRPIARDWSPMRKRFVATVACISTALIGILIGIYAGEVPSIQYYIADFQHFAILGNVFMFIGLAISNFFCWPLPLLHGRKPYILSAMTIAMPLLFPQAIVVSTQRSPYTDLFRVGLILPRAFMGFVLGFANMNTMATLTDLFGASLQSGNPHQEIADKYDVRRHGGGMGIWLGIWTWCYMGSIGVGFMIGAWIINSQSPDWGFYVSIIIIAAVLLLNVVTPEVRRSAFRRSVAEVRNGSEVSRRLAKGEVMMHRLQTGPKWWGEEFLQGVILSRDMLRQPGFVLMTLYVAWMYGQTVLVIVLLGSLMSKYYRFISPFIGLTTLSIPIGAMLAIPFQKASFLSRARHHPQRTDSMTFERRVTWTSHLVRRAIFTLTLPFAGLAYTLSSSGPPTPFILPILFAGLIGFLSNLAIAECNGIIMEAFDTSDLQPGMTGRPRGRSGEISKHKRTNYSSFPRVTSAFAIIQSLGFLFAALATGVGGAAQRHLGQQAATGVMAGILLLLTVGVLGVLIRWKDVQIIPAISAPEMEKLERNRKESVLAASGKSVQSPNDVELNHRPQGNGPSSGSAAVEADEPWRPIIIGNPSGKTRRMSILELGHLSRWSEIRRRNRLVDEVGYEGRHPNLAIMESVKARVKRGKLGSMRNISKRENKSQISEEKTSSETGDE